MKAASAVRPRKGIRGKGATCRKRDRSQGHPLRRIRGRFAGGQPFQARGEDQLRGQLFVVLSMLLEHAGEVVTREELQRRLWPGDVFVDFEVNLNTLIARLREVLGDSAEHPRYIETLPKRGYRFLATVSVGVSSGAGLATAGHQARRAAASKRERRPGRGVLSDAMTDGIIIAFLPARARASGRSPARRPCNTRAATGTWPASGASSGWIMSSKGRPAQRETGSR
ncbi:MAG: winged helix-turn-helix domain-containing protein [Sphingobacterium sp.]|nr:winged helix-turn-helix domain-containing protein [Sphingobacterium sp.]